MKTRKLTKVLSVLLAVAMLAAMMSVMSCAAGMTGAKLVKAPYRTIYYEGYDINEYGTLYGDPTGAVMEIFYDDGTSRRVTTDDTWMSIGLYGDYTLGENKAWIEVADDLYWEENMGLGAEDSLTVTVKENPVASVEITKMPVKTEYYFDDDVILKKDFTLDKLDEKDPGFVNSFFKGGDGTLDDVKAYYKENPEEYEALIANIYAEGDAFLVPDLTGMEIKITYKDGTTEVLGENDDYNHYDGFEFPVSVVGAENGNTVIGANKYYVMVMGNAIPFELNVKAGSAPAKPEEKPTEPTEPTEPTQPQKPEEPKAPVIPNPNTDGSSVAAAAVIAVMSACALALIPSKKEK